MPIVAIQSIDENTAWGLWEIRETVEELQSGLMANLHDQLYVGSIRHEVRRGQTLAARLVVQQLLAQWGKSYAGIVKNNSGKPYLADCPYHISISHTDVYAAAMVHKHRKVGIDIEYVKEKLQKVALKYLSYREMQDAGDQLDKLCVYWCAKEVLYKMSDCKQLVLNKDIQVKNFKMDMNGTLQGRISGTDGLVELDVIYSKVFNLIIAYCIE
jgi:4'-phosphopantetheinyl transferase EntD